MEKKLVRNEYTTIKVVATFLVVIGHVAKFYNAGEGVIAINPNKIIGSIATILYTFHMPLFIFVSGALYSFNLNQKNKYKQTKKFIAGKFKRLICPYWFWGIIYVMPVMVLLKLTSFSPLEYIVKCILAGADSRHLWYLLTLFEIFVICCFVKACDKWINKYVLAIGIYLMAVFLYVYTGLAPIWNLLFYGFFFVMGYLFDLKKGKIDDLVAKRLLIPFTSAIILGLSLVIIRPNIIMKFIFGLAGIMLSYVMIYKMNERIMGLKMYPIIARDSMGIYLIHPMLIYIIYYYFGTFKINSFIFFCTVVVIVSVLSILLTELLRKCNCNVILGE